MKILEVIPHLQSGGGEKFVVDLSNTFSALGHECTVATLYDPSDEDILRQQLSPMVATSSLSKKRGVDLGCMYRLYRYIKEYKPDVVHLHLNAITYALFAALFYRKCKFVATIHHTPSKNETYGIQRKIRNIFNRALFRLGIVVPITISKESEKAFETVYGFETHMIPNGSSSYIKPSCNIWTEYRKDVDFLFVHVARIEEVKNQLMLVQAFDQVIKQGRNLRLLLVGRVADEKIYEQIKPYFSDRIVFVGEQQDVRAIMSASDGFCLTSNIEGMPITIIEAFSVGCVPIVTPAGGCINMIKPCVNGYLSKDMSSESYIHVIEQFIALNQKRRAQMSAQGLLEYKMKYSIDITAKNYLNIFNRIV